MSKMGNMTPELGKLYKLNKKGRAVFGLRSTRDETFLNGLFMIIKKEDEDTETPYFVLLAPDGKQMAVHPSILRDWFIAC